MDSKDNVRLFMTHYLFKLVRSIYISFRQYMFHSYRSFLKDALKTYGEEGAKYEKEVLGSLSFPLSQAMICPNDSIYNGNMAAYCPCCGSYNGARLTDIGLLPTEPNELLIQRRQKLLAHLRDRTEVDCKLKLISDNTNARNIA